ncbi:MAG: hypothetical protein HQL89_18750 [Magnetococcales bacterium]|nr:hypothetical protein [Magnetococcales bacterium]
MKMINIPTFLGQTLNGFYLGTRVFEGKPDKNGQTKKKVFAAVGVPSTDEYGNEETAKFECVVPESLLKTDVLQKLHQLVGTEISLPVWYREWSLDNGRNGTTCYLAADVQELFK